MQFSGRLVIIAALAVSVLIISNIIAVKPVSLFEMPFEFLGSNLYVVSASVICFPLGYIISDVLTEVYGFRVARGVIWLGFACNLLVVIIIWIVGGIPGAVFWEDQASYETILGATPWILLGSFVAYLVGEFSNAMVMVVLKNRTEGRMLWLRTISSTIVGQGIDSILFYSIAFGVSGIWGWQGAINGAILAWIAKTLYEILATPFTYMVVNWLKRTEKMDIYDAPRSLNPFGVFGDGDQGSFNAANA
ncbi:MAG: queuosine precursor transporter [Chloroflexi bacterium]|nr:queuosine precursor transporter [Chloroflexota bacterium]